MFSTIESVEAHDAKVIKRARKNVAYRVRWGRWWGAIFWSLTLAMVISLVELLQVAWQFAMGRLLANQNEFWLGFILGLVGGMFFFKFLHAMWSIWLIKMPDDRDRLLLEYHDALAEIVASQRTPSPTVSNST